MLHHPVGVGPVGSRADFSAPRARAAHGVILGLSLGLVSCASEAVRAPRLDAVTTVRTALRGEVKLDLSHIPEEPLCSFAEGAGEICVRDLQSAYTPAITALTNSLVASAPGPRYRAVFRVLELSHFPTRVAGPTETVPSYVDLRWQFLITDNRDNDIFVLTRQTRAPGTWGPATDRPAFIHDLLTKTVTELANALNAERLRVPDEPRVFVR